MDLRVGSAPARSSMLSGHGSLAPSESSSDIPVSGFLNRKCVTEAGGKKSKDRSWQTYWCQLKGVALEFHRVDGVKSEGFKPPPRDIYPPPHMAQHKAGFVSMAGATAEDDYTSQLGKDLHKRRDWLFELTLSNKVVYLLQAPNKAQRAHWIQQIRRAASGSQGDDVESRKLKAARCSVRHRSRQYVLSVKAGQVEGGDTEMVTAVRGNPSVQLLKDRLRAKKELLTQINRMYYSFLGDTGQLYNEDVRRAPGLEALGSPHRHSLQSPVHSLTPLHRRASTGTTFPNITTSHTRVRCRVVKDHLLVPGASWSQVREGEEVVLTARLPGGWFRCLVQRDVSATLNGSESVSVSSRLSEASRDSGLPPSNRDSAASDTLPEAPSPTPAGLAASGAVAEMFVSDSLTPEDTEGDICSLSESSNVPHDQGTGSHDQTNVSHDQTSVSHDQTNVSHDQTSQQSSPRMARVGRSYSYIAATQTESSLLGRHNPRRSLDLHRRTEPKTIGEIDEERNKQRGVQQLEELLFHLTETHQHTSYTVPLVGVVPPSVVEKVPEMSDLPLLSTAVSPLPFPSPEHSLTLLDTPQHSVSHQQSNGHISSPVQPLHSAGNSPVFPRKPVSYSAPTTPLHTPHQPLTPATTPEADSSQGKLVLSPNKSPRPRRRSHDPVTTVLESGPSLIKRLLPRKKMSKQTSLTDKFSASKTPTIDEEMPYSPSPSPIPPSPPHSPHHPPPSPLPPPALLDFTERELQGSTRMRVSSVSGRPVRSTGIGLQFGEDESSSESDLESSMELDPHGLSASLPSTGGFSLSGGGSRTLRSYSSLSSALLLPPRTSPDIMAPGNLRRAASAHDSLAVKIEPEPISKESRSKSGSAHSLTSALVRGLHNSFRRNHVQNEEGGASKKRSSSKKKRQGSVNESSDPESPRLQGIFRQPPTGQKRFVYLDPRQPKYGFRLESYGRPSELGQEMRVFVQSVTPGSPAFMSGLFPGDTILEVNGVDVRCDPVAAVVKKIMDVPRKNDKKIQLTVMFADGVTRLEKMKKTDNLRYQMKMKQAQLRVMISEESSLISNHRTTPLPPARSITLATDLQPWSLETPPTGPSSHCYPYDSVLNELVSLCSYHPSELASDALVLPLCVNLHRENHNILTQTVLEGGSDLVDELSLTTYCPLGENVITRGYQLPAHTVYHCVFGDLEESLQRCIWRSLEDGCSEPPATIAFWLDGFMAINVSPHSIMEFVRLWLQQGGNTHKYTRIVFSATSNPDFAKMLLERYFPLAHFYFKVGSPGSVVHSPPPPETDQQNTSADEGNENEMNSPDPQKETAALPTPGTPPTPQPSSEHSSSPRILNPQRLESEV